MGPGEVENRFSIKGEKKETFEELGQLHLAAKENKKGGLPHLGKREKVKGYRRENRTSGRESALDLKRCRRKKFPIATFFYGESKRRGKGSLPRKVSP